MTKHVCGAAALIFALIWNAATVQAAGPDLAGYYQRSRCITWDGYRWLNMCWRSRNVVHPTWSRFHR